MTSTNTSRVQGASETRRQNHPSVDQHHSQNHSLYDNRIDTSKYRAKDMAAIYEGLQTLYG